MWFPHDSVILRILALLIRKEWYWLHFYFPVMAFITGVCSLQAKNHMWESAVFFLLLLCSWLATDFGSVSVGPVCWLEEIKIFRLPHLILLCSTAWSIFCLCQHHNSPLPHGTFPCLIGLSAQLSPLGILGSQISLPSLVLCRYLQ